MRAVLTLALLAGAAAPIAAQQSRNIAVGQSMSAELSATDPIARRRNSPYHIWSFEGRRGQRVMIDVLSGEFDSYLMLRDEAGNQLGADDDSGEENNARLRTVLPRDGSYRIIVTAFSENGRGRYTLAITGWEAPESGAPGAIGTLVLGQRYPGMLEPGDSIGADGPYEDRWTIDARAGNRLRVDLTSSDFDSYLVVLSPDGRRLAADDDGGEEGDDASISFRAAESGRYTIIASSYTDGPVSGTYRISAVEETGEFAEPGEAAVINSGQTREGRLETGDPQGRRGHEDRWTFNAREGEVLRIDVTSSQFDPYVLLMRGGMPVDSNDDGGEGTNARLMTVAPSAGAYTLVVSAYSSSGSGGRYNVALGISQPAAGAGRMEPIRAGQRLAGRLEMGDRPRAAGGFMDTWEFEGRAGQDIVIEMHSADFDAYLELRDPQNNVLSEDDDGGDGRDAMIITRLSSAGRYRIVARSFGDAEATGFYELSVAAGSEIARPGRTLELRPAAMIMGRLESGDTILGDSTYADVFTFRAAEAGEVTVDMRSGDFDTYLIVKDAEGVTLATDDDGGESGTDSRIMFRAERGRVYRVYANSYGEDRATGLYRLSLRYSNR